VNFVANSILVDPRWLLVLVCSPNVGRERPAHTLWSEKPPGAVTRRACPTAAAADSDQV